MNDGTEQPSDSVSFGVSPSKRTHGMVIAVLLAVSGVVAVIADGPTVPDGETKRTPGVDGLCHGVCRQGN